MPTPSYTHTIQSTYKDSDSLVFTTSSPVTGDTKTTAAVAIPAGAAAQEIDLVLMRTKVQSLLLGTSGPALVVTPYNGAVAEAPVNIPANGSVQWNAVSAAANPLSGDVTKLVVANTAATPAAPATLTISVLQNLGV